MRSALEENVEADCAVAEADADIMCLYGAVMEQQRESKVFAFSPAMNAAARVLLPGRIVDYLERSALRPCVEDINKTMTMLQPDEASMLMTVLCKCMALFIRDHPEEGAAVSSMYATARVFTSLGRPEQCVMF